MHQPLECIRITVSLHLPYALFLYLPRVANGIADDLAGQASHFLLARYRSDPATFNRDSGPVSIQPSFPTALFQVGSFTFSVLNNPGCNRHLPLLRGLLSRSFIAAMFWHFFGPCFRAMMMKQVCWHSLCHCFSPSWGHRGEQDRTEVGSKAPPAVAKSTLKPPSYDARFPQRGAYSWWTWPTIPENRGNLRKKWPACSV